ncbi:tetrapyrrole biosynthesis, uroporphyrinogen III synthase [Boletus reticuloceps]|uniref:Tetrapyrrole biosynthesis, uroporphyrinogen III synthase n=1 Tax=Boletus reticuloceps TaxID=495285 RepID=A0A8I3ACS5_9AGAM|nr:tetrapyrrole biosynthesis, uroporphyrinogen III synthase [Boletus reticuloceps]
MKNVLLLRAPREDGRDRYETVFEAKGYAPLSVPVLETVLVHVDALRDKIPTGGQVPFYVVGDATAAAASQISTAYPSMVHLAPAENQVRGGAEAGTAERLAEFILEEGCEGRRLLYLTGDKNRETLPGMLAAGGVALDTLEVYGTTGSSTFRDDLQAALERTLVDGEQWGWVVYFAPSAAAFVTPILCDVFQRLDALKVAAIGPTTASFIRDTLKMRVDVVALKPSPDALCHDVVAFDDGVACTS